jgi:hypothetical protein
MLHADLLISTSGQFYAPRLPDTAGLYAWLTSERATHAVTYRPPGRVGGPARATGRRWAERVHD